MSDFKFTVSSVNKETPNEKDFSGTPLDVLKNDIYNKNILFHSHQNNNVKTFGISHYNDINDPINPNLYIATKKIVKLAKNSFAIAGCVGGPFTRTWLSTGFKGWIRLLYQRNDVLTTLLDKMTEYSIEIGKRLIEEGVDIIWISDDYGDVRGPLIRPKDYQ